ncbi:MAG: BatA domain-containing protein [Phycisphaerales bacterium]
MNFLNPGLALAGLACVAVPILIHILMRRRRRPVPWGAMQFLLAAYRQQRRRMNLEQWLLLAARCLIVALAALAVGKPVLASITGAEGVRARTLYILLDNSLTSQASPDAGDEELAHLKSTARAMLATLSAGRGDRAALITLAGPARAGVLPPAPDATQVAQLVDRAQAVASRADIEGAAHIVRQSIADAKNDDSSQDVVVLLSTFRAGSADLSRPLEALSTTGRRVRVLAMSPADRAADNVSIVRAEPLRPLLITGDAQNSPAGSLPVRVELARSGPAAGAVTKVRAWVQGADEPKPEDVATTPLTWNAGQRAASVFVTPDVRPGPSPEAVLHVQIDADAIAGDNTYLRPLDAVAALRIALVAPSMAAGVGGIDSFASQDWLALALAPQTQNPLRAADATGVRVEVVDPVRLAGTTPGTIAPELAGANAVIVTQPHTLDAGAWRAIASASARGAFVLVVPPEAQTTHMWTDALAAGLDVPWHIAREASAVGGSDGLAIAPATALSPDEDLLALVRPELEELVKPVRVRRVLTLTGTTPQDKDPGPAASATLLALSDGTPLLVSARPGQGAGVVALWLAPPALAWTDLPAKPLMVPLMQELVRQGAGRSGAQRTATAGAPVRVQPGATELASAAAGTLVRVSSEGSPMEPLRETGLWHARSPEGHTLSTLAVNHDPLAGDTTVQRSEDTLRWLAGLSGDVSLLEGPSPTSEPGAKAALTARRDVPPVSLPLLIAAGALALLELLMARWFSHARVDTPGEAATTPGGAAR